MNGEPNRKNVLKVAILAIIVAIIVFSIVWIIVRMSTDFPTDCGADKQCFIDNCKECKAATLMLDEEGTLTEYKAFANCTLTRTITKIADDEPEEVRLLFEDKGMSCSWEQGEFDEDLVNTFSLGIDACEGRLALAIASLVEVMLEEAEVAIEETEVTSPTFEEEELY